MSKDDEELPDTSGWKTIGKLSAEETAAWLRGERVTWTDHLTDPELELKIFKAKNEIRLAVVEATDRGLDPSDVDGVKEFAELLMEYLSTNKLTVAELQRLLDASESSPDAYDGLCIKIAELLTFAYTDA